MLGELDSLDRLLGLREESPRDNVLLLIEVNERLEAEKLEEIVGRTKRLRGPVLLLAPSSGVLKKIGEARLLNLRLSHSIVGPLGLDEAVEQALRIVSG